MKTKLSALLAFVASLTLAAFMAAQSAPSNPSDSGSQPAAQSQPASSSAQQAQPAAPSSSASEATSPADQSTASDQSDKMPKTASDLPLVAVLGLASLGAGFAAHRYSRRFSEH